MAEIFISAPGTVSYVEMRATLGRAIMPAEIKDPELIPYRPLPIIFGAFNWRQQTHHQFAQSLDGSVYIYVFGDQMGSVIVSGYAFNELCAQSGDDRTGLQIVLDYYEENRASQRPSPIQIEIANKVVQGFLTQVNVVSRGAALDPGPVLHEYSLEINALP